MIVRHQNIKMMNLNFTKAFIVAAFFVLFFGSCTTKLEQMIRASDGDQMYAGAVELFERGKYNKAINLFSTAQPYLIGRGKEDSVAYYICLSYYKMGDFVSSTQYLNGFRRSYSRSPFLEEVEYMYAMSAYYTTLPSNRDQTMSKSAIISIKEYLGRYPDSHKKEKLEGHVEELVGRMHEKEYINAKVYYNIGQYRSAVVALQGALDMYPESKYREDLLFLILDSHYIYAKNSIEEKQRDRFLDMMDAYYNYTSEFPDAKKRKDADKMQEYAKQIMAKYNTDKENGSEEKQ